MNRIKDYVASTGNPSFSITITFVDPEKWNTWLNASTLFYEYYIDLFRQCVYETHKYLIRLTPIQTGKLRAGWTGILTKYNIDYTAAFLDTSLLDHAYIKYDQAAIQEGFTMSQYIDSPLDVTIINTVPYAEYVEFGTSKMEGQNYTNKARYKGEYIFKKEIDDWFKEMSQQAEIVKPQPVEEVVA